jgi:hypothetical protein
MQGFINQQVVNHIAMYVHRGKHQQRVNRSVYHAARASYWLMVHVLRVRLEHHWI